MSDALDDGRVLRTFNVLDDYHREVLRVEIDVSLTAEWVTRVEIEHIQPGKPSQNGFIERFNGSYRTGVLDAWVFTDLDHVRE